MESRIKPFVKWVGGKTQLLPRLLENIPDNFSEYWEPMVGGGALFWRLAELGRLQRGRVVLMDANASLIAAYQMLKDPRAIELVIKELIELERRYTHNPEDTYYAVRDAWNDSRRNSAYFIFLKQTAFNGLWRENSKGKHNAPWGHYRTFAWDAGNLRACSRVLQDLDVDAQVMHGLTWGERYPRGGALVYFDPPYAGTFDSYTGEGFTSYQQKAVITQCAMITEDGGYALYTQADTEQVRQWLSELWPKGKIVESEERRSVNSKGGERGPVKTLIVHS
jgi:DNA adenine methylase